MVELGEIDQGPSKNGKGGGDIKGQTHFYILLTSM